VSTWKKSQASRPPAWTRRNVRQDVSAPVVLDELHAARDSTDGGIADPVTQADQLAAHSIPPAGILPRQSQNQSTVRRGQIDGGGRGSSSRAASARPAGARGWWQTGTRTMA
jgi:hypothetical protein